MYLELLREDNERSNAGSDGPVKKTGLKALHDAAKRRMGLA